ncbi:MAG: carboxypeptidase-like regulatory domain-containing protein, partial [Candidatus Micrarchaeota archaeon]|nr:carboxypeptidase-like regulatory domain-containing protein [Candidatus Micrarchaeota archaeon]
MKRDNSVSGLEKKFADLEKNKEEKKEEVERGLLGKKGFYDQKEDAGDLGKGGFYKKQTAGVEVPQVVKENPAVIVILLLAIVAIGYFVFFFPVPHASGKFDVVVFAGEARLTNAVVTVYDGQNVVATGNTDAYGKVSFANLPNKPLRFAVSSEVGSIERSINPTGRRFFSFNINSQNAELGEIVTLTVLDESNRQPISGIKIAYSLGSDLAKQFVETNANGKAEVDLRGETILRMRLVDPLHRYDSQSLTMLATQREVAPILLKPYSGTLQQNTLQGNDNPLSQITTTDVTVLVRDENGEVVTNGQVTALYTFTGVSVGGGSAAIRGDGSAVISGITVDSFVSFTVNAPGFYPGQSASIQISSQQQPVIVSLQPAQEEAPKTKITIIGSGAVAAVGGQVHVFQRGNLTELIYNSLVNNSAEFSLEPGPTYYALVIADGYVSSVSSEFASGEEVTVELVTITSESAAALEVNLVDEDAAFVSGAGVAVLDQNGFLIALPQVSEFGVPVVFTVFSNSQVEVRASLEPSHSSQNIEVNGDTAVTLTLLTNAGFLTLNVKNLQDNSPVHAVTLTSFYNGKTYQTCNGNGGCTIPVRANSDVAVQIDAVGFLPYTYYAESIAEFATKTDEVRIVSASLATSVNAELIEIVDSQGNAVSGDVLRPGIYTAKFFALGIGAKQLSFYARIGDGKQNASLSSVHLLEPISTDSVEVAKSASYSAPQAQCVDLINPPFSPPYKWVELTFTNTSSQEVNFPFEIPSAMQEGARFSLEFRAKAVSGNGGSGSEAGSVVARFPSDPVLGFAPASSSKANCYANTVKQEFVVSASRAPVIENVFPVIGAEFTSGDALVYDPVQRRIKSQNALQVYELQVDSILPGDAMPLELQSDGQCTVIAKQPNSTAGSLQSSSCYFYDSGKKMLVFQSRELNPYCPIYLKNDKFYSVNGTRVNSDSANLSVVATCVPDATLEIPIKVNFVSDVASLQVKPDSDSIGEGDAAKLIYLINNRQLASRPIDVTFQSSSSYQLQGGSAKALAWRGPGILEISEGGNLLSEVIITNQSASSPFKPGIGVLSHRQTSCDANDISCCANGWCTRSALTQFIPGFKETANRVAMQTAFRRGNSQPFAYFSSTPFKFVTVVQAAQGASTTLTVEGVNFSSPIQCLPGNPGVYQLTASSTTGAADGGWNYSASTLNLVTSDYIQLPSSCGGGSNATQVSLTAPNGGVQLCNFLSPKNNCIESTRSASITSIDQVDKLEFELTNCMYPVFPSAPVCPGTKMILPAVNIGSVKTEADFNPSDSPNAFSKIWTSVSDSNASSFSLFSWQGQIKCLVPPSFQQFGITAASLGLNKQDFAEEEAKSKQPLTFRSDVCSRQDFFNLASLPNTDTLIPLAGVCCPTSVTAQQCTPRRGKFFVSVKDNEVKIITSWGLTESCYPYWPFPTTVHGLLQKQNLVSATFGLAEFLQSNGADFEMSLASETPGDKPVAATGLSNVQCSSNSDCKAYEQCAVDRIYNYQGSGDGGNGQCIGASSGGVKGVCSFSSVSVKTVCSGGQQCKQDTGTTASCAACGEAGQACCIQNNGNAMCKAGAGCIVTGSRGE